MNFTPGPWKAFVDYGDANMILAGLEICTLSGRRIAYLNDIKDRENARLIAAAPDLYAALEEAMRLIGETEYDAALDLANAIGGNAPTECANAIAKHKKGK